MRSIDSDGIIPRGKKEFPLYSVGAFTTTGSLYKIQYFLTVKANLSGARDIILRKPIVVCPFDHATCKEEMKAIEESAKEGQKLNRETPMVPAQYVVKAGDPGALQALGMRVVANERRLLID